ncbi:hypothetical protein LTR97_002875 [Elasticomyces elasticus]|uniref:C2H2-type domain-containing protein n=1 Tax=Elasticomyces elasticus TaxID=574655 RepID=A0AAN7W996_9PEZI|nr:hypothetical protein LTR97_002875 [Elasticomyces elasticus]
MSSAAIPLTVNQCFDAFDSLCEAAEAGSELGLALQEERGRFKVWTANISAHRAVTSRRSLEYRLRDSSNLRDTVKFLLQDLLQALQALADVAPSSHDLDSAVEAKGDAFTDEDDDFDFGSGAFTSEDEEQRLLEDIHDVVNCLMRFSMTLRNPARHDHMRYSVTSNAHHYEPFDREHVRSKYPEAPNYLVDRLGKSISRHRLYFDYREQHHAKLAEGLEHRVDQGEGTVHEQASTIATSVHKDVERAPRIHDSDDESVYTATSFASSASGQRTLRPPPLPAEGENGDPFECKICFTMVIADNERAWRQHVYEDLPPYVCMQESCATAHQPYARRREWQQHERDMHHRAWACPYCKDVLATSELFQAHVVDSHNQERDDSNMQRMVDACAQPLENELTTSQCPLCQKEIVPQKRFFKHLGHHLEELALFSLPSHLHGDESDAESDGSDASDIPQAAIDVQREIDRVEKQIDSGTLEWADRNLALNELSELKRLNETGIDLTAAAILPDHGGESGEEESDDDFDGSIKKMIRNSINFEDAVGRHFSFPWSRCKTWEGMESMIKQAFTPVAKDFLSEHVHKGHYDLAGPDGQAIPPQTWNTMIRPEYEITMHMWPMPEREDRNLNEDVVDAGSQSGRVVPPRVSEHDLAGSESVHENRQRAQEYQNANQGEDSSHSSSFAPAPMISPEIQRSAPPPLPSPSYVPESPTAPDAGRPWADDPDSSNFRYAPRGSSPPTQAPPVPKFASSYWSVPEQQDFVKYISYFGTDFAAIAAQMGTKTQTMIKNHYQRQVDNGNQPELENAAKEADRRRELGDEIGPPPTPTPIVKRKYDAPQPEHHYFRQIETQSDLEIAAREADKRRNFGGEADTPPAPIPNAKRLNSLPLEATRRPVYPRVARKYLDVETLKYYNLPYEVDRDYPEYIIIRREMNQDETDVLFEHTARLRSGDTLKPADNTSLGDRKKDERQPVFPKVHRRYLDVETLQFYGIPFERDRVHPDYFILLRQMDKHETDILFEHTRKLRSAAGQDLISKDTSPFGAEGQRVTLEQGSMLEERELPERRRVSPIESEGEEYATAMLREREPTARRQRDRGLEFRGRTTLEEEGEAATTRDATTTPEILARERLRVALRAGFHGSRDIQDVAIGDTHTELHQTPSEQEQHPPRHRIHAPEVIYGRSASAERLRQLEGWSIGSNELSQRPPADNLATANKSAREKSQDLGTLPSSRTRSVTHESGKTPEQHRKSETLIYSEDFTQREETMIRESAAIAAPHSYIRQPWTKIEEDALLLGIEKVDGPYWAQILAVYGSGGSTSEVLKNRTREELAKVARNLKLWYLKTGTDHMPDILWKVPGELAKSKAVTASRSSDDTLDEPEGENLLGLLYGEPEEAERETLNSRAGTVRTRTSTHLHDDQCDASFDEPKDTAVLRKPTVVPDRTSEAPDSRESSVERITKKVLERLDREGKGRNATSKIGSMHRDQGLDLRGRTSFKDDNARERSLEQQREAIVVRERTRGSPDSRTSSQERITRKVLERLARAETGDNAYDATSKTDSMVPAAEAESDPPDPSGIPRAEPERQQITSTAPRIFGSSRIGGSEAEMSDQETHKGWPTEWGKPHSVVYHESQGADGSAQDRHGEPASYPDQCNPVAYSTLAKAKGLDTTPAQPRQYCPVPGCEKSFQRTFELQRHQATYHGMGTAHFHCLEASCGYQSLRFDKIREHCHEKHGQRRGEEQFHEGAGGRCSASACALWRSDIPVADLRRIHEANLAGAKQRELHDMDVDGDPVSKSLVGSTREAPDVSEDHADLKLQQKLPDLKTGKNAGKEYVAKMWEHASERQQVPSTAPRVFGSSETGGSEAKIPEQETYWDHPTEFARTIPAVSRDAIRAIAAKDTLRHRSRNTGDVSMKAPNIVDRRSRSRSRSRHRRNDWEGEEYGDVEQEREMRYRERLERLESRERGTTPEPIIHRRNQPYTAVKEEEDMENMPSSLVTEHEAQGPEEMFLQLERLALESQRSNR